MTREDETFWEAELQRLMPDPEEALEVASGYVCCPVCQVLVDVPWDFLRALPVRWPEEPALRAAVSRAGGFCNPHSWRLVHLESQAGLALIYVDVMGALVEQDPRDVQPCPICRLEAMATDRLLALLIEQLRTDDGREYFGSRFGLCYPHWRQMLGLELPLEVREFAVQWQREHALSLRGDLAGFLRKDTPKLRGTRTHDETRAPRRAVLKTAGNEEI